MRANEFTEGTAVGDFLDRYLFGITPKKPDPSSPTGTGNQSPRSNAGPKPTQQGNFRNPSNWPVQGRFNRGFGSAGGTHMGVDIECMPNTPVKTVISGRVGRVDTVDRSANGKYVTVVSGAVEHMFLHLNRPLVTPGQQVQANDVIGLSGNTGRSTGPHLHWQVQVNGRPVDPLAQ